MQVIRETVRAPGCVTSVFHPYPPKGPYDIRDPLLEGSIIKGI